MLSEWWTGWGWPTVPLVTLSPIGVIVDEIAAGFLYETQCNVAYMEWIVADPKADKDKRSEAINNVIREITNLAKEKGYTLLLTMVKSTSLMDRLDNEGFIKTDENMVHFMKLLKE